MPQPAPAPNILLFAVDTLRADRVGAIAGGDLTPRIDAFATGGRTFSAAYTQATQTHPAMASVMTGLAPPHHGVLAQGNRHAPTVVTLAELLQDAGFATGSFVANLCQLQAHGRTVWSDGWDEQFCGEDETAEQYLWDESVVARALEWIDGTEQPFFAWIHLMDPHGEYRPSPADWDYAEHPVRTGFEQNALYATFTKSYTQPPDELRLELEALYDAQIHGVDRQFGRVLDFLTERGFDENTYVVFVADHGEELFETWPKAGHGFSLTEGVLRVPLILAGPGIEPGRVEQVVETLQVTPTLLELLAIESPSALDGGSLLADSPGRGWAASFVGDRVSVRRSQGRWWGRSKQLRVVDAVAEYLARYPAYLETPWYRSTELYAEYVPGSNQPQWRSLEAAADQRAIDVAFAMPVRQFLRGTFNADDAIDDPALDRALERLGYK